MKVEENTTEETDTNACESTPPAFVRHRTIYGEAISHSWGAIALLPGPDQRTGTSDCRIREGLGRAIERSRVRHLCFDWDHHPEINAFISTVASLHREEQSTTEALDRLHLKQALPPSACVPDPEDVLDVCRLDPTRRNAIRLSDLELAVHPWVVRGFRRCGLHLGDFEIIVNWDLDPWIIERVNGAPLGVPGASYTILCGSTVVGASPTGSAIGTSNFLVPHFENNPYDDVVGFCAALDDMAASKARIVVDRTRPDARSEGTQEEVGSYIHPGPKYHEWPRSNRSKIAEALSSEWFPLTNGRTWSTREAHWCDGLLRREDVAAAVREIGKSMRDLPTQRILECQHRFIQMAGDVNWDCDSHATPEQINDVLDTWNRFSRFLEQNTAGRRRDS